MRLILKSLTHLILWGALSYAPPATAQADELPNPYKLDLREATEEQKHGAITYASKQRITIVLFSDSVAAWKIIKDVGQEFARQDIPINIVWAKDNDDNIQTAKVLIFAHGKARDNSIISTKLGYLNYDAMVQNGYVEQITDAALEINRAFFKNPD